MKYLLLSLFVFSGLVSNAKCISNYISCWPSATTIRPNGIIIIEFYGGSKELVTGIGSAYPIYLKSGDQKIKLLVTETLVGEFGLTQILLKAEKALTPGSKYELVVDNLPKDQPIAKWDRESKKQIPYSWTVLAETDLLVPQWKSQPTYESKSFQAFGCGPAKFIYFNLAITDASDVFVKTTVRSLSTGKSTSYYLLADNGKLKVGHGMCSGAFIFRDGKEYEVSFSLMDACGNTGCENTTAQRFTRPEETDQILTK